MDVVRIRRLERCFYERKIRDHALVCPEMDPVVCVRFALRRIVEFMRVLREKDNRVGRAQDHSVFRRKIDRTSGKYKKPPLVTGMNSRGIKPDPVFVGVTVA
jgi:hypothetical protein